MRVREYLDKSVIELDVTCKEEVVTNQLGTEIKRENKRTLPGPLFSFGGLRYPISRGNSCQTFMCRTESNDLECVQIQVRNIVANAFGKIVP